jgi:hypothetical protein
MDEEEPPRRRDSPWLSWGLVIAAAAGSLWLASRSLEGRLPPLPEPPVLPSAAEPEARREVLAGTRADLPPPLAPAADPPRGDVPAPAPPPTVPFEETPLAPIDEPLLAPAPSDALLRSTIERQLAMNDLAGVQVEIVGERVITGGRLPHAEDRARVRLLVRALAPELIHEDRTVVSRAGAAR